MLAHAADVQDRDGARRLAALSAPVVPAVTHVGADGAYAGRFVEWAREAHGWTGEVVKRTDGEPGFEVLPRRRVVERTFAWLGRYRRLSKDDESYTGVAEAFIDAAMIQLMLRRLTT